MTKEEMQLIIDTQQAQIEDLRKKIAKITSAPEEAIRESALYQELKMENQSLKEDNAFYRNVVKSNEGILAGRKSQIEKLKSQCANLLKDSDGRTEEPDARARRMEKEYEGLMERYSLLEEKCESRERYAKHLENKLNDLLFALRPEEKPDLNPEKEPARSRRVGRPRKASRSQISEARQWRRDGYSIREIARLTEEKWGKENAWSVSYVQKIVGNIKIEK